MDSNNNKSQQQDQSKPTAYRVDDDDNLEEKDLKRSFLFGDDEDEKQPGDAGMEGTGMGGENFGKNNVTPSADDKDNPSRNAGYTNDYFKRTEPAQEHPENSNFKTEQQSGGPDYSQAQPNGDKEDIKADDKREDGQQRVNTYNEGTLDNDKSGI